MPVIDDTTFVHGGRPTHLHHVKEGEILCNSPYCGDVADADGRITSDPRVHAPVIQGREPWRQ